MKRMIAKRKGKNCRFPREELSPGLREAVQQVMDDPLPEALMRRVLQATRRQVVYYPRRPHSRFLLWTAPVIAASIAWFALTTSYWAARAIGPSLAPLPTSHGEVVAALSDDLPTAWAYSRAARRSPETLYALMDRQSRQSIPAGSRLLAAASVSPFASTRAGYPMTAPSSKPVITLDQLIALNDEIAALVRAGVPLDRGLLSLGEDLPGRLGRFAAHLSAQVARGESLTDALSEPATRLPQLYRAVIEAGIAAGRLPAALESLAGSLRRLAQTRRSVVLSLIYPFLLFLLAWGLFAFSASVMAPAVYHSFQQLHLFGGEWFKPLAGLGQTARIWGPLGPAVLLVLAWLWWAGSKGAAAAQGGGSAWVFAWIPGLGHMLRLSRTAVFVEVLKLLVENRVPLDQAVTLAAAAAGDARLSEACATGRGHSPRRTGAGGRSAGPAAAAALADCGRPAERRLAAGPAACRRRLSTPRPVPGRVVAGRVAGLHHLRDQRRDRGRLCDCLVRALFHDASLVGPLVKT